jgi:hypothetical protein
MAEPVAPVDDDILDLDALMPKTVKIRFNGSEVEVKQPKVNVFFKLATLSDKILQAYKDNNADDVDKFTTETESIIKDCIPELAETNLNADQIGGLAGFLMNVCMPSQAKQLAKHGITPVGSDGVSKKKPQDTSDK